MKAPMSASSVHGIRLTVAAVALACLFLGCPTAMAADAPAAPEGWRVYRTGELSDADRACAAGAYVNRFASVTNGVLRLYSGPVVYQGALDVPFAGGRLVGIDLGEFGGRTQWVALDGSARSEILAETARALLRTPYGNFLVTGGGWNITIDDQVSDGDGAIWRLSDESARPPNAVRVADIEERPQASSISPDGSALIVTRARLLRLVSPGSAATILKIDLGGLFPNSIAEMPDGVIYVGMRHFLARLVPTEGGYQLAWLLPADCPLFTPADHDCVCSVPVP